MSRLTEPVLPAAALADPGPGDPQQPRLGPVARQPVRRPARADHQCAEHVAGPRKPGDAAAGLPDRGGPGALRRAPGGGPPPALRRCVTAAGTRRGALKRYTWELLGYSGTFLPFAVPGCPREVRVGWRWNLGRG